MAGAALLLLPLLRAQRPVYRVRGMPKTAVTPAQIAAFRRDGFVVFEDFLSPAELQQVLAARTVRLSIFA